MKKTEVVKVEYNGSYLILPVDMDTVPTVEEIMEDFELGDEIKITKIEMTEKVLSELPEFDGW